MAIPNTPSATRVVSCDAGAWTRVDTGMAGRIQVEVQNQTNETILVAFGTAAPSVATTTGWQLSAWDVVIRLFGPGVGIWVRPDGSETANVAVNEIGA